MTNPLALAVEENLKTKIINIPRRYSENYLIKM